MEGLGQGIVEGQDALDAAYVAHPERFPNGRPAVRSLPDAVYINPPENLLGKSQEQAQ